MRSFRKNQIRRWTRKKILTHAAAVGSATVRALAYRPRDPEAHIYPNGAWQTPFVGGSYEFYSRRARLLDSRSMFFLMATGITPAMALKTPGAGSQYLFAATDDAKETAVRRSQSL